MKQWVDYLWILWSAVFEYIFGALMFWHLWLALPFVSGYNWTATVRYLVTALVMYFCGCFAHDDWRYRQDYYVQTYPGDCYHE